MVENLVESFNQLLLQHAHLFHLIQTLFWIKYWILMGIMSVFIYLVYTDKQRPNLGKRATTQHLLSGDVFIACH